MTQKIVQVENIEDSVSILEEEGVKLIGNINEIALGSLLADFADPDNSYRALYEVKSN